MMAQETEQSTTAELPASNLCNMHKSALQFFSDGIPQSITELLAYNRREFYSYSEATCRAAVSKLVSLGYLSKKHIGNRQYRYQITEAGKQVNS
jgi:Fic family protein